MCIIPLAVLYASRHINWTKMAIVCVHILNYTLWLRADSRVTAHTALRLKPEICYCAFKVIVQVTCRVSIHQIMSIILTKEKIRKFIQMLLNFKLNLYLPLFPTVSSIVMISPIPWSWSVTFPLAVVTVVPMNDLNNIKIGQTSNNKQNWVFQLQNSLLCRILCGYYKNVINRKK